MIQHQPKRRSDCGRKQPVPKVAGNESGSEKSWTHFDHLFFEQGRKFVDVTIKLNGTDLFCILFLDYHTNLKNSGLMLMTAFCHMQKLKI